MNDSSHETIARALADAQVDALFAPRAAACQDLDLATQLRTGGFPPEIERLQRPILALQMREGLLIQKAVAAALDRHPAFIVLGTIRVGVTASDRALAERNRHADLACIAPPAPGDFVGSFEFDVVAADGRDGTLLLLDIKRASRRGESDAPLREASLAARRMLQLQGLAAQAPRVVRLRWFDEPRPEDRDRLCRGDVDERLAAPVRAVVDATLARYRTRVAAGMRTLVAGGPEPARAAAAAAAGPGEVVNLVDVALLRRAFESWRAGGRK